MEEIPPELAAQIMDRAVGMGLEAVRAKHGYRWDHIGPDTDTPGWRASREIGDGVTHHIVTRTLPGLDRELDEEDGCQGGQDG